MDWSIRQPSKILNESGLKIWWLSLSDILALIAVFGLSQTASHFLFKIDIAWSFAPVGICILTLVSVRRKQRKHFFRDWILRIYYLIFTEGVVDDGRAH